MSDKTEVRIESRQLEMVRRTGACNMIDGWCAQRVANEMELYELVNLIGNGRRVAPEYSVLLFAHQPFELTEDEQTVVDEWSDKFVGKEPDTDDSFPLYLEYDGLFGAPDYLVEQSAQEEDRYEAEALGES